MSINKRLNEYVDYLKEKHGKSETGVSKKVGIAQSTFHKAISGETKHLKDSLLEALAKNGLNIHWLLLGEGEMMREPQDKKNISQGSHSVAQVGQTNTARQSNSTGADMQQELEKLKKELEHARSTIALQAKLIKALEQSSDNK